MIRERVERLWHGKLKRPYRLAVGINWLYGKDGAVVLLHGIGSTAETWQYVADNLQTTACQILAFDLLGFGASPKPDWPRYTADDHAAAVIAAITRYRHEKQPVILVGHSMGSLIAVRVAYLRPDLVKSLILYQPPLYVGLPEKRCYRLRRDLYYRLYEYLLRQPPQVSSSRLRQAVFKQTGLDIRPAILPSFLKSLRSTIMEQTTLADMGKLKLPIDIVYGSLDIVVIRGKRSTVFADINASLQTHTIAELHGVSKRASRFIAERIRLALSAEE